MKGYIICPVRNVTDEQQKIIDGFVDGKKQHGWDIHNPKYDAPQDDPTGYNICMAHKKAMKESDEIFVFWDVASKGSHFDLGMAFAMDKPITLVYLFQEDGPEKSYVKVMKELMIDRYKAKR